MWTRAGLDCVTPHSAPDCHQCRVYVDQLTGGGVGALRLGARRAGPGPFNNQRGVGGAPPYRGRGGHRGPRRDSHQLQGREAAHAPSRLLPGRPAGSHLRGLQHVREVKCGPDSLANAPSPPALCSLRKHIVQQEETTVHGAFCPDSSASPAYLGPLHVRDWSRRLLSHCVS